MSPPDLTSNIVIDGYIIELADIRVMNRTDRAGYSCKTLESPYSRICDKVNLMSGDNLYSDRAVTLLSPGCRHTATLLSTPT